MPPGTRTLSVAAHCEMAKAVTVLAQRREIGDLPVRPISIDMMQKNYLWMGIVAAVGALSRVDAPSIQLVGAGSLRKQRVTVPRLIFAFSAAEFSTGRNVGSSSGNVKTRPTFHASALISGFPVRRRAGDRAKVSVPRVVLPFICEYLLAVFAGILPIWMSRTSGSRHRSFLPSAQRYFAPCCVTRG